MRCARAHAHNTLVDAAPPHDPETPRDAPHAPTNAPRARVPIFTSPMEDTHRARRRVRAAWLRRFALAARAASVDRPRRRPSLTRASASHLFSSLLICSRHPPAYPERARTLTLLATLSLADDTRRQPGRRPSRARSPPRRRRAQHEPGCGGGGELDPRNGARGDERAGDHRRRGRRRALEGRTR